MAKTCVSEVAMQCTGCPKRNFFCLILCKLKMTVSAQSVFIFPGFSNFNLTLLPTAFYDFLSYGEGIFIPHPRKQC